MTLFVALLTLTASTRLVEIRVSCQHRRRLIEQGATPSDDRGFLGMVLLHVGILVGSLVEVIACERFAPVWLSIPAALGVMLASALRVWAIRTLGVHWNVRVIDSTTLGVVNSGPYHYIRHPNYVAVFSELALLPLVQGAWLTATIGTAVHLLVLRRRINHEESVLNQSADYRAAMAEKPRFFPFPSSRSTHLRASGEA